MNDTDAMTSEGQLTRIDSSMMTVGIEEDRALLDIQIATAKQYPRSIERSLREAIALVTSEQETAISMHYALPRTDKTGKKIFIEGPSVRAAEVLAYCWQNIRTDQRIVRIDSTHVTAQGTCLDLERNTGVRVEVQRRITDKNGRRFGDDMIVVTGNAAASIAFRNAVFKVIPAALSRPVLEAARELATGGALPLEARRQNALRWFARVGAPEARVLELLGHVNANDIDEDDISLLSGLRNAIMEGDTTVEEAFAAQGEKVTSAGTAHLNDKLHQKASEEAIEAVLTFVAACVPAGSDATDAQRTGLLVRATKLFGSDTEELAAILTVSDHARLGKRQAGALLGRLDAALQATFAGDEGEAKTTK